MRIYLELIETNGEMAAEFDFIRVDVTDWSENDVNDALDLLKQHAAVYEHYVLQKHHCKHEEGEPCTTEVISSNGGTS
jgi:hypothetical protein